MSAEALLNDLCAGGTLIIWDRLFGTFVEEHDGEPLAYGKWKQVVRETFMYNRPGGACALVRSIVAATVRAEVVLLG